MKYRVAPVFQLEKWPIKYRHTTLTVLRFHFSQYGVNQGQDLGQVYYAVLSNKMNQGIGGSQYIHKFIMLCFQT